MKKLILFIGCFLFIAGCGYTESPEERAEAAAQAALYNQQTINETNIANAKIAKIKAAEQYLASLPDSDLKRQEAAKQMGFKTHTKRLYVNGQLIENKKWVTGSYTSKKGKQGFTFTLSNDGLSIYSCHFESGAGSDCFPDFGEVNLKTEAKLNDFLSNAKAVRQAWDVLN